MLAWNALGDGGASMELKHTASLGLLIAKLLTCESISDLFSGGTIRLRTFVKFVPSFPRMD